MIADLLLCYRLASLRSRVRISAWTLIVLVMVRKTLTTCHFKKPGMRKKIHRGFFIQCIYAFLAVEMASPGLSYFKRTKRPLTSFIAYPNLNYIRKIFI